MAAREIQDESAGYLRKMIESIEHELHMTTRLLQHRADHIQADASTRDLA